MGQHRCDVEVIQSAFWQTNTGVITDPNGNVVLVDPGVLPAELDKIVGRMEQQRVVAALATHEDWDHVLWPDVPDGNIARLAHPETVRMLSTAREELLASLISAEDELGVSWNHDLVGRLDAVPDATVVITDHIHVTFIATPGHTEGHASITLEGEGILFAGDMLSDIDIPMIANSPGALGAYRRSLAILEPLIESANTIIPGHGTPCGPEDACNRLRFDRMYLDALRHDVDRIPSLDDILPGDPRALRAENREAHQQHLRMLANAPG